jgi:magnesium transporter
MERLLLLQEPNRYHEKREALKTLVPADIADQLFLLPLKEVVKLLRVLPKDISAEVFSFFPIRFQKKVIALFTQDEIKSIIEELYTDDAADLIDEMPANLVPKILKDVSPEVRNSINHLLNYPEDSVGSVMTPEFVAFKASLTITQALTIVKKAAIDKETIYKCYVVAQDRLLIGVVEMRTLLSAKPKTLIKDVMRTNIIKAKTTDDKESLVHLFNKYPLLSLPVTDLEGRMVGVVTHDDAVKVMRDEFSEDLEFIGKLGSSDKPYLQEKPSVIAKNRVVWLLVLMLSATITGFIITQFEGALAVTPALISFIPMLMDTGGNAGSQASITVIKGLALKELRMTDMFKILFKEMRISILVGLVLSVVNFFRIWLTYNFDILLSLTVSLTLVVVIFAAKTIGSMLPLLAKKLNLDPALMAAPFITTLVDASALVTYFFIASAILGTAP